MNYESPQLEYWLSPQRGRAGHSSSVLRRMALNDAQSRATSLMMYFWCAWLMAIAITLMFAAPDAVLYPAVAGVVVGALAVMQHIRRRRREVPSYRHPASSRAPRSVRGAWTGVALVTVGCVGLMVAFGLSGEASMSPESVTGGVLGLIFTISLFMGTLLIPAWHIEHADRLFRSRIERDAGLRRTLEDMSRTYSDPSGRLQFGPL